MGEPSTVLATQRTLGLSPSALKPQSLGGQACPHTPLEGNYGESETGAQPGLMGKPEPRSPAGQTEMLALPLQVCYVSTTPVYVLTQFLHL